MYVIYINDHLGNPITQFFELSSLDVKIKLNDISTTSFVLPTNSINCKYEYFKEFNQIKICKIINNIEKVVIDGVIRGASTNLNEVKIDINCRNFLLKKKIIYVDKTYTNQSINNILTDIISDINSRDTGFITLNCDINTLVTKTYNKKKNLFDILKDLAGDVYEFIFQDNILTFTNTIGSDKSVGADIVLFEFDINSPKSRTIAKAESDYDSNNIANAVIGEDGNNESSTSITEFGRIEEGFSSGLASDLLNERKDSIKELNIEPMTSDFFICDIGDIVKVYINTGSDMMYFDGALKVIEKSLRSGNMDTISIKLNTGKVKTLNLLETINNLKSRVGNLEIK